MSNDEPEQCPECGAPLESDRLCPNCLLKMVLQPTDQFSVDGDDLSISSESAGHAPNDKAPVPDLEAVRQAFPQLEIIEMIGRGGMGTVFKARQPKLDRYVALKILSAELARKPTFANRFAREGKLLARLSHPNVVTVYDYGESAGFYYLILEFVDGVNLRQAMREREFSPEQALSIVPKICEALQYAHDEGVLHRDIKPENILLDLRGRIKITDFGIGKLTDRGDTSGSGNGGEERAETNLTDTGQILGTPNYMAPEQKNDPNSVDHRADIYSLGVVFYELLTGELPRGRFPVPSKKAPVDAPIDRIVLKALERERERRQQSADEMKTAIEAATSASDVAAYEKTPTGRLGYWGAGLILAAVLFFSVFLFLFVQSAERYHRIYRSAYVRADHELTPRYEAEQEALEEQRREIGQRQPDRETARKQRDELRVRSRTLKSDFEQTKRGLAMEKSRPARLSHERLGDFLYVAAFISVPTVIVGSVFGWCHLAGIRRYRNRSGLIAALFASLVTLIPVAWAIPVMVIWLPFGIRNWGTDHEFALVAIFTVSNIVGLAFAVYVLRILYRWLRKPPTPMPSAPEKEQVVVAIKPRPEKPGLWRRIAAEVKTWPAWATILVICVAGPMALYIPILFLFTVARFVLFLSDDGLRLHENWQVISPLITPVGLLLLTVVGFYIYNRKRKRK